MNLLEFGLDDDVLIGEFPHANHKLTQRLLEGIGLLLGRIRPSPLLGAGR